MFCILKTHQNKEWLIWGIPPDFQEFFNLTLCLYFLCLLFPVFAFPSSCQLIPLRGTTVTLRLCVSPQQPKNTAHKTTFLSFGMGRLPLLKGGLNSWLGFQLCCDSRETVCTFKAGPPARLVEGPQLAGCAVSLAAFWALVHLQRLAFLNIRGSLCLSYLPCLPRSTYKPSFHPNKCFCGRRN